MTAGLNCHMQKPVEKENYKEVMELLKHFPFGCCNTEPTLTK